MSSSDNPSSGKEDKKPTAPSKKPRSSFAEFRKNLGGKKKSETAESGEDEILVIEKSSSKQKLIDPSPISTPTGSKKEILEESKADPVKKDEKPTEAKLSNPNPKGGGISVDTPVKKDLTLSPPQSRLPTSPPKRKEFKGEISGDEKEDREEKADFDESLQLKQDITAKQSQAEKTKSIKTDSSPKVERSQVEKTEGEKPENLGTKSTVATDSSKGNLHATDKDSTLKDKAFPPADLSPRRKEEIQSQVKVPGASSTKVTEVSSENIKGGKDMPSVDQEKAKDPGKESTKEKSDEQPKEDKESKKVKVEGEDSTSTEKEKSKGGLLSWFGGKSKDNAKNKETEQEKSKEEAKDKSKLPNQPHTDPQVKEGEKIETSQANKAAVIAKSPEIDDKSALIQPSTPKDKSIDLKSATPSPSTGATPSPSQEKRLSVGDEKSSTTPPLSKPFESKGGETPHAAATPSDRTDETREGIATLREKSESSPRNIEAKSRDSPKTSKVDEKTSEATIIPAADPEPIKKKGFIQNLFDNSSLFNVMSKIPIHPSKTNNPEKVQSASAGEKYRRTTAVDHATAIQAAWRGKKTRKWLKIRNLASISIQRIYRGVLERKKTLPILSIKREKDKIKHEQKQRMRDINQKEKDLKLLSRLPPEEYLQYENVRKQSAAKVIQAAWRQSNRNPLNYKFQEHLSYSTKKKYPIKSAKFFPFRTSKDHSKGRFNGMEEDDGEEEMKGEVKKSLEAVRLEKIVTASFRKRSGVAGGNEYLEQIYEPRNMIDYSMDENAISLSMLYQRIRAQASERVAKKAEEKRKAGSSQTNTGPIGGMRQRYGELLEAQQKADIILEEYLTDKSYLDYRKTERRKSLCTINELVDLIKHPLSLDEAADFINDSNALSMDEKRRNYAESWLYAFDAEYVKANLTSSAAVANGNKNTNKGISPTKEKKEGMSIQTEFAQSFEEKRKAKIFDLAMESHLTGADTMVNSSRWDAVFVPAILTDHTIEDEIALQLNAQATAALTGAEGKDASKLTSSISMPKIKKLTKSESLKNLAKKWSTGEEVGDSLYWVTYATQPSKLLSEVNPNADITELIRKQAANENYQKILKEFHSSYFNPKQRLEKTLKTIEKENNQIQRLAKIIEKQTWKEIRLKFSDDFKELSAKEKAEKRMKSIIYVQSIMRGYLTRRRYQKLKQQQRFYQAVQHLLNEMELLKYEQNHPHHTPPSGNRTVPSIAANFLPKPSGGPKGALLSSVEVQQQQMISEIARITSSALKTPFQVPLPSSTAKSSSAKTKPATTTVLPPLFDRGLNPPTVTQSIDYSSSNATTPLRHLMSKSANLGAVGTSSTSITPAKFDQVTKRTPYPENLNLPPHQIPVSVTNTPHQQRVNEISQNYNQNDRVYSLRKVDEPVNVQLSARSGSIGGGSGALGFETPLLQTPRGQFTAQKGEVGGSSSKNNDLPPSIKLPKETPRTQSQITPRDAVMNPNPTAPTLTPMRPQTNPNDANQAPKSHRKQTPPTNPNANAKHNTSNNSSEEITSSLNYTTTMTSTPLKQDQSTFLSPFLEMNEDEERRSGKVGDDDDGYISSPSQTSLSRSLSVSFGQVTNQPNSISPRAELISSFANPSNKGSGKAVAFASSASSKKMNSIMKSRFPYIPDPLLGLLVNIERQYVGNQCNVNDIVDSALVADIGSFDKKAAIDFTVALLKKFPGKALITWLSEIPIEKAIMAKEGERSTKNIELSVEIVAITLAEISLYDPNTMKIASSISERDIHNITQFTLLMRLFGAGTDSGNIRVLDLNTWFMELFILVISAENIQHRMDSSKLLAKLRCYLAKEAAKKGTTNFTVLQEYLDDIVPDYLHEGSDRGSVSGSGRKQKLHETEVSLDLIQELFSFLYQQYTAYYTNKGINPTTPAGLMTPLSAASPARHMVRTPERNVQQIQMLIRILSEYHYAHLTSQSTQSQSLAITTISLKEIQEILCALPTYRQLQRKIQTWFRAVPESFTTIINGLNINANSISQSMIHQEIFINILAQSLLPTNHSENRLFADLLQRRSDNTNNTQQTPSRKKVDGTSEMLVDIRLLNRVKNGEFLQVQL